MGGRGRGFVLKKPEKAPIQDQSESESVVSSAASSFHPFQIGRAGRGIPSFQLRPSNPQQPDPPTETESSVSVLPFLGRGRGLFKAAETARAAFSSVTKTSSDPDSTDVEKQFAKGQFDDLSPKRKSDSSGRGRSTGRESDEKSSKSLGEAFQKLKIATKPNIPENIVESSPQHVPDEETGDEPQQTLKHGAKGTAYSAMTNCIMITCDKDFGVFEYEVRFNVDIDNVNHRYKYLGQLRDEIGSIRIFDGVTLYLPIQLPNRNSSFTTAALDGNGDITVNFIFRRKKRLGECVHLYNVLFERIMRELNYQRVGRKSFDPSSPKIIKQHKLEVWPGYVKTVEEMEGGLMLLLDVSHRVLSQKTVLEFMSECSQRARQNYKDMVKKALIGHTVLTRYNNKTYRVDDIDFDSSPKSTFKKGDADVTYCQYYQTQYGLAIRDLGQPLLIHREDVRLSGCKEKVERVFCLVPELCYMTGLTDEMRSQFTIMKDLAVYTKLSPYQRFSSYQKYIENINKNPKAKQKLLDWGLALDTEPCKVTARLLNQECVIFGQNKTFDIGPMADFSRNATSCQVMEAINLNNWILVYVKSDLNTAENFEKTLLKVTGPIGMRCTAPQRVELLNDRTETFVNAIRDKLRDKGIQMVVTIFPTLRDDRYAAVKKTLCSDIPCPSQCINSKTLRNEAKNRSIIQKIVLQMNCKLGGSLWSIKIPLKQTMIVGIDTYHEANQKGNSVGGFVASMNSSFTKWNSIPTFQKKKEELINGLVASMERTLRIFKQTNNFLPDRIIIYRDGVGDGQLNHVENYEIPQFMEACEKFSPDYKPKITFIVVQKRINHKFFKILRDKSEQDSLINPPPGSVLDNVITRRNAYDFFLCSQHVREGTVTPSHYVVLRDDNHFEPDIVQQLTYKLSYLYYNWPGAVRVPAPCQYAHKLSYLVGLAVKANVDESLMDKLFYL